MNPVQGRFEELLAAAAAAEGQQLAMELEEGSGEGHVFSSKFDSAMADLLQGKDSAPQKPQHNWRRGLRAACLGVVCLAGLSLGALQVEAIRVPLLQFLVDTSHQEYTSIDFQHSQSQGSDTFHGKMENYLPTALPAGYLLEEASMDDYFILATYASPDRAQLSLSVTPNRGSSVSFDTQDCVVTQREIGTRHAYVSQKIATNQLLIIMFDNNYSYNLSGTISQEEAVAMMESIP